MHERLYQKVQWSDAKHTWPGRNSWEWNPPLGKSKNERVEWYLRPEEGTTTKEAYLRTTRATNGQRETHHFSYSPHRHSSTNTYKPSQHFQPYIRNDMLYKKLDIKEIMNKQQTQRPSTHQFPNKNKYYEYLRKQRHNITECMVLKQEIQERINKGKS